MVKEKALRIFPPSLNYLKIVKIHHDSQVVRIRKNNLLVEFTATFAVKKPAYVSRIFRF